jgi:hypothetical protein
MTSVCLHGSARLQNPGECDTVHEEAQTHKCLASQNQDISETNALSKCTIYPYPPIHTIHNAMSTKWYIHRNSCTTQCKSASPKSQKHPYLPTFNKLTAAQPPVHSLSSSQTSASSAHTIVCSVPRLRHQAIAADSCIARRRTSLVSCSPRQRLRPRHP